MKQTKYILRNSSYIAVAWILPSLVINRISPRRSYRFAFSASYWTHILLPIVASIILALFAKHFFGHIKLDSSHNLEPMHKRVRFWATTLSFVFSIIAYSISVVVYNPELSGINVSTPALVINLITLMINGWNTHVQAKYANEDPANVADKSTTLLNIAAFGNALNLWGFLLLL